MLELEPRSAFQGLLYPQGAGPGVSVREVRGFALASVLARKGADLTPRVREIYGADLPQGPGYAAGAVAFVGVGPGAWLALGEGPAALAGLEADLTDLAVVIDQSGGRGLLRLEGRGAADLLSAGIFLDLHAGAFPPGAAASTRLAHVSVDLWRTGPDSFEMLVPRSFAPAVAHWLSATATGLGVALKA